jgi:hypothetical protein
MPSHNLHRKVEQAILGETFSDVHRLLDLPGLMGVKRHRRFLHSPVEAFMVGYALHGEKGALSGLLHITLDKVCNDKKARRLVEAAFR